MTPDWFDGLSFVIGVIVGALVMGAIGFIYIDTDWLD